ncbi:MAG: hypothetical protein RLZZ248_2067 [Bacteroidota bacterium]
MRNLVNLFFKAYFRQRYNRIIYAANHPIDVQSEVFYSLINSAKDTEWGRLHKYREIKTYEDFTRNVPLQDYDSLKPYIQRMMHGERAVLWPGRTKWFAKSSGTTTDQSKFIPVSMRSLRDCHMKGSRDSMALFYNYFEQASLMQNHSMIVGGSLYPYGPYQKSKIGDVSAIMMYHLPSIGRPFFTPDVETALLADWDEKIEKFAQAAVKQEDVVMIAGVPTWTVLLLERILKISGKENMLEVWPEFQVYFHGGVSFLPYKKQFEKYFPSPKVKYHEVYNATEGYFATKVSADDHDLLLLTQNGIYYEFIPLDQYSKGIKDTLPLEAVEMGKNYVMVISTIAGLWRFMVGDTVRFTNTKPYKITISGRTKQFINVFGEEVMVENTDRAVELTCKRLGVMVKEYTVGPLFMENGKNGAHQWLIEFASEEPDIEEFAFLLDQNLRIQNSDYDAKRFQSMALRQLELVLIPSGGFESWMKKRGKYGGQHKVPRLANDRQYVDEILNYVSKKYK